MSAYKMTIHRHNNCYTSIFENCIWKQNRPRLTYLRQDIVSQDVFDGSAELLARYVAGAILVDGVEGTAVGLLGVLVFVVAVALHERGELLKVDGVVRDADGCLEFLISQFLCKFW